jgi:hypothetical protein
MKLHLTSETRLNEIQAAFNDAWPCLKIEFFTRRHSFGEGTPVRYLINKRDQVLGNFIALSKALEVEVHGDMKVGDFELLFQEKLNLPVQVYWNPDGIWLETTRSDQYTLDGLNQHGKEEREFHEQQLNSEPAEAPDTDD